MNGAFRIVAFGCETLSLALTGLLLQQFGVLATILCFEVPLIVLALAVTLNRALRTARPIAEL